MRGEKSVGVKDRGKKAGVKVVELGKRAGARDEGKKRGIKDEGEKAPGEKWKENEERAEKGERERERGCLRDQWAAGHTCTHVKERESGIPLFRFTRG